MDHEHIATQNSLQELATLLSYLYDHYIKKYPKNLSHGLLCFMGDMGLLGNQITVIEIENIRRIIQSSSSSHQNSMSYEEFYLWLREIACCLFFNQVLCPKKSLHKLLVEKIIPFGSNWGVFVFSETIPNSFPPSIFEGIVNFHEFFRSWYLDLTLKNHPMVPIERQWKEIIESNATLNTVYFLKHLEDITIIPQKISRREVSTFVQAIASASAALCRENSHDLRFSDFLLAIGFVANSISLYTDDRSMTMYHSGLHFIVQSISDLLLALALKRWSQQQGIHHSEARVRVSVQDLINETPSGFLNLQTLLILCRNANIVQSLQDITTVVDTTRNLVARKNKENNSPLLISFSRLSEALSSLSRRIFGPKEYRKSNSRHSVIYNTDSPEKYLSPLIGGSERCGDALLIASTYPQLFYTSSITSISTLEGIFSDKSLWFIESNQCLKRILECLQEEGTGELSYLDKHSGFSKRQGRHKIAKLLQLLHDCAICPHVIDEMKFTATIRHILHLGPDIPIRIDALSLVTEIQMIEILFYLAGIAFSTKDKSFVLKCEVSSAEIVWETASNIPSSNLLLPAVFISDEVDRFIFLAQLCDPISKSHPPLSRLNILRRDLPTDSVQSRAAQNSVSVRRDEDLPVIAPSTVEFSSHFGYLFTQFLTLANIFYFEVVQGIPTFKRFEMTFIQKSFLTLLLLYPVNDFAFSPWDLADMIIQFSNARNDNNYLRDSDSNFSNVQLDLRHILLRYQISGETFERYLQHILEKSKLSNFSFLSTLNEESYHYELEMATHSCLVSQFFPLIRYLFDEDNRELLKEGSFLFIWEYLRCIRGNSRNDFTGHKAYESGFVLKSNPFMEQFRAPFPTRYMVQRTSNDFGISWKAALQWAITNSIPSSVCLKWYRAILVITGAYGLHYSGFILFVICCYAEMLSPSLSSHTSPSPFNQTVVANAIKTFYQQVTSHIQKFQQVAPDSLFPIILDIHTGTNLSIRENDMEEIVQVTLSMHTPATTHRSTSLTPSRPDLSLWDGARWLQYCKMVGITELVSSFHILWNIYRVCLRAEIPAKDLEIWDESVVPPIAVHVEASAILRCLGQISIQTKSMTLSQILCCHHIPYLASLIDDNLLPSELNTSQSGRDGHGVIFEDLFRLGGNRLISTLEDLAPWLQEIYYKLAESAIIVSSNSVEQAPREPLLTTVCRFLSSSRFFSLGSVSVLVKQCFGFRTRFYCHVEPSFTPDDQSISLFSSAIHPLDNEISLSFLEYEELLLRCAYQMWEKAGLLMNHGKDWYGAEFFQSVKSLCPTSNDELVSMYCQGCRNSLEAFHSDQTVVSSLQSSKRLIHGGKTWGLDFFTPFCHILRQCELPTSNMKEKHELVAQYVGESLKPRPTIPVQMVAKKEPIVSDLRPQLSRQLEQMNMAKAALLDQESLNAEENLKSVVERSEELVASILAKRDEYDFLSSISHPPSPPPSVKEQTRVQLSPASQRYASCHSKDRLHKRQERMTQLAGIKQKQEEEQSAPRTPLRRSKKHQKNASSPTTSMKLLVDNSLFIGIQEALWPVFATYCSCGDSTDPGKLSGPNLFTLLSKLDILTIHTTLSDIGILLHQISAHSLSLSPFVSTTPLDIHPQQGSSPLLSFEEFIIFLCAFSELRSDGVVHLPSFLNSSTSVCPGDAFDHDNWLHLWNSYFIKSKSFTSLFHDCILPVVNQSFLLASPDDARERDVYSLLFSLDVLFSIESIEKEMLQIYSMTITSMPKLSAGEVGLMLSNILEIFKSIKLIPQVMTEKEVKKLFDDIIPSFTIRKGEKSELPTTVAGKITSSALQFPQWEWVSCVVAFKAVTYSIEKSECHDNMTNLSMHVSEVLSAMVHAMNSSLDYQGFRYYK